MSCIIMNNMPVKNGLYSSLLRIIFPEYERNKNQLDNLLCVCKIQFNKYNTFNVL